VVVAVAVAAAAVQPRIVHCVDGEKHHRLTKHIAEENLLKK
jgi:hypothetical protein